MPNAKQVPELRASQPFGVPRGEPRLSVTLASEPVEVELAQRLRYKVFAEELGARLTGGDGLDRDEFDDWCDHLIVRDDDRDRAIGTYRILPPHRARAVGRLYTEGEFDIARLAHLRPTMIEVGRACVHRDYRSGAALMMLWAGLAQYMKCNGYRHLIGCASVPLADGGGRAARLRDELQPYLVDVEYRVFPRLPFPHARIQRSAMLDLPPLIKGYLRLGARVCGEPAWDPDFNSADTMLWLALDQLNPRYARHFDLLAGHARQASA
jgi:putative hemolysin